MEATEAASKTEVSNSGNCCGESVVVRFDFVEILSPSICDPECRRITYLFPSEQSLIGHSVEAISHSSIRVVESIGNLGCAQHWICGFLEENENFAIAGIDSSTNHYGCFYTEGSYLVREINSTKKDNYTIRIIYSAEALGDINHSQTSEAGKPDPRAWVVATATMSTETPNVQKSTESTSHTHEIDPPEEHLETAIEELGLAAEGLDEVRASYLQDRIQPRIRHFRDEIQMLQDLGIDVGGIGQ